MILLAATGPSDFAEVPLPTTWTFDRTDLPEALQRATEADALLVDLTGGADISVIADLARDGEVYLLAIVASDDDALIDRALIAGATDVLARPVTEAKLAARLALILRLKAETDRARAIEDVKLTAVQARPCRTHLVAHRGGYEAAVNQLEAHCASLTSLIVMRHTGLVRNASELGLEAAHALETQMSDRLAKAMMPAGEILAALGGGFYVHLAVAVDTADMEARAQRYLDAASDGEPGDGPADAFALETLVVGPSTAPLSALLADAISSFADAPTKPFGA